MPWTKTPFVKSPHGSAGVTGPPAVDGERNAYVDVVPFARRTVAEFPDRVLWGPDWPHPNVPYMPHDGDLMDLVPVYAPDADHRRFLLVDNPARLFRFAP